MESPEHQEWRSRQAVSWPAIWKSSLGLGLLLFIFGGGTPWTGAAGLNQVMGRPMPWPWPMLVLVHFGLAVVYMMVIANVIYRMRVISAIASGVGLSILLYALNYIVFTGLGMATERGDVRALSAHLVLGLLGSALYKAISVPPPMQEAQLR